MRFKGRKCAEKVNMGYLYMQSDMYNLYPTIGAVNAMRQNYNFALLPDATPVFGTCQFKIYEKKVEPPKQAGAPYIMFTLDAGEALRDDSCFEKRTSCALMFGANCWRIWPVGI